MKSPNISSYFITILSILIVLIIVISIWFNYGHFPLNHFATEDLESAGQYGDSFGMINSLFSGLAFACLIITILLQWHELRQQRIEITRAMEVQKESLSELKRQAELQNKTQYILKQQADSLFLAAYVNALTSRYKSPLVKDIPIEKRHIYESMDHTVTQLESHSEKILGPTLHRTKGEWLSHILDIERQELLNKWPKDTWRGDHPIDLWNEIIQPFGQWFENFRQTLYVEINTADTVITRIKEMESIDLDKDFDDFYKKGSSLIFEIDVLIRKLSESK